MSGVTCPYFMGILVKLPVNVATYTRAFQPCFRSSSLLCVSGKAHATLLVTSTISISVLQRQIAESSSGDRYVYNRLSPFSSAVRAV